jgi:hypothetical protein
VRGGTVTANFAAGNAPRFFATMVNRTTLGGLDVANVEAGSGAVTRIDDLSLSGATTNIQNIAGTANWTMGRWFKGEVTDAYDGSKRTLTGNNENLHYFIGNSPAAFPTTGTYTCASFRATDPSATTSTAQNFGTVTGTATLSFNSGGATLGTEITVTAGTGTHTATRTATLAAPTNSSIDNDFANGGEGVVRSLFEGGNGSFQAAQLYRLLLSNGTIYQGVVTWTCTL